MRASQEKRTDNNVGFLATPTTIVNRSNCHDTVWTFQENPKLKDLRLKYWIQASSTLILVEDILTIKRKAIVVLT